MRHFFLLLLFFNLYFCFKISSPPSSKAKKLDYFFVESDWEIEIKGLVETPMKIKVSDLLKKVHLEERFYRHRCVEAWVSTFSRSC